MINQKKGEEIVKFPAKIIFSPSSCMSPCFHTIYTDKRIEDGGMKKRTTGNKKKKIFRLRQNIKFN